MKHSLTILTTLLGSFLISTQLSAEPEAATPIKALLITGGCCHDYDNQREIIPAAIDMHSKVPVEWTILHQRTQASDAILQFYENPRWAEGYDIVVHNECFGKVGDADYIDGILQPHREGLPAVLIHCSMHSYRTGPTAERWWEFCGVHSPRHGPKHPYEVEVINSEHEITAGLTNWTTPEGELYYINKIYPGTIRLAESRSEKTDEMHTNIWAHLYGPNDTRVFATTIGHHNATMLQAEYMELITRGFLWAASKSVADNLISTQ